MTFADHMDLSTPTGAALEAELRPTTSGSTYYPQRARTTLHAGVEAPGVIAEVGVTVLHGRGDHLGTRPADLRAALLRCVEDVVARYEMQAFPARWVSSHEFDQVMGLPDEQQQPGGTSDRVDSAGAARDDGQPAT